MNSEGQDAVSKPGCDIENNRIVSVRDYAVSKGLDEDCVIQQIREGQLAGHVNNNTWYVDLELMEQSRTRTDRPLFSKMTMKKVIAVAAACLCVSAASLYYFSKIYDVDAGVKGYSWISGRNSELRIGGSGFEGRQQRLRTWEKGKLFSKTGLVCSCIVVGLGSIIYLGSHEENTR
jgi:hypothetical protein